MIDFTSFSTNRKTARLDKFEIVANFNVSETDERAEATANPSNDPLATLIEEDAKDSERDPINQRNYYPLL